VDGGSYSTPEEVEESFESRKMSRIEPKEIEELYGVAPTEGRSRFGHKA
jgi:hypothetical protein